MLKEVRTSRFDVKLSFPTTTRFHDSAISYILLLYNWGTSILQEEAGLFKIEEIGVHKKNWQDWIEKLGSYKIEKLGLYKIEELDYTRLLTPY